MNKTRGRAGHTLEKPIVIHNWSPGPSNLFSNTVHEFCFEILYMVAFSGDRSLFLCFSAHRVVKNWLRARSRWRIHSFWNGLISGTLEKYCLRLCVPTYCRVSYGHFKKWLLGGNCESLLTGLVWIAMCKEGNEYSLGRSLFCGAASVHFFWNGNFINFCHVPNFLWVAVLWVAVF